MTFRSEDGHANGSPKTRKKALIHRGFFLFLILFVGEQKGTELFVFRTKLAMRQADSKPALFCESWRRNMIQTKATIPKTLAAESEQAINFLTTISDMLKQQRRHFDDAVVTHCIRLINDYVDEKNREAAEESQGGGGSGPRT